SRRSAPCSCPQYAHLPTARRAACSPRDRIPGRGGVTGLTAGATGPDILGIGGTLDRKAVACYRERVAFPGAAFSRRVAHRAGAPPRRSPVGNYRSLLVVLALTAVLAAATARPPAQPQPSILDCYEVLRTRQFVDLTHTFGPGIPHWPGFPDEKRETL